MLKYFLIANLNVCVETTLRSEPVFLLFCLVTIVVQICAVEAVQGGE